MLRGTGIILLIALTVVAALVAIAACGGDEGEGASGSGTAIPTAVSGAPDTPTAGGPVSSEIEAEARKLLAEQVGEGDFTLTSSEGIHWSDASLGCPKEGFGYAQVITPGYKLIFELEGVSYPVHTNADGSHMVICRDGQ